MMQSDRQKLLAMAEESNRRIRNQQRILTTILILCMIGVSLNIWRSYRVDKKLAPLQERVMQCRGLEIGPTPKS